MAPAIRFDSRFVALATGLAVAALAVPPLFRNAVLALAIAMLVLAPLPRGTRGLTFAVMIGLASGSSAINVFVVGLFQLPVTREFGWTQAQYSLVIPIGTAVTVLSGPLIGRLFDRCGVRWFAIACTALLAAALVSLHWLTPPLWHLYLVFALLPLLGAGTSSIAYSRVVARWFAARRGQAFGAALAGIGIGGAVLSALSQSLIDRLGWRTAYLGLALLLLAVTLPVLWLWLHDAPADVGRAVDGDPQAYRNASGGPRAGSGAATAPVRAAPGLVGYSAIETRRLPRFWLMLAAFFIFAFGTGGVMLQLFPILRARGIAPDEAAAIQSALGLALIVGRAFAGFLMDRLFAPYVAIAIILFPTVGTALLASGLGGASTMLAAVSVGLAAGAELDVVAYLCTRYFGTRGYAENYGWQYAAWTLGAGAAPFVTARSFDLLASYTPILWVYVGLLVLSALLISRLGPYPQLGPYPELGPGTAS